MEPIIDPRAIYYERKQREEERRAKLNSHICAQCGSKLVLCFRPQESDELITKCGNDKSHQGIVEQKSLYKLWKEGYGVPLEVDQKFRDMTERRKEKQCKSSQ